MVHPAPADKTLNERRREFIKRTGAILDVDPTPAEQWQRIFFSKDDEPYDSPLEKRTPTEG